MWSVLAVDENAEFAEENRTCPGNLMSAKQIAESERLPRYGSLA